MSIISASFERFLQLAGDFAGRGLHSTLHGSDRACKRLVESFSGGWPANRDEPGLVGREFLSRLMELLAGQGPAPAPLGDDTDMRAVHPLDHVRLAILLIDHRRVVLADQLALVQLLIVHDDQ
jgi:hypothetical protein